MLSSSSSGVISALAPTQVYRTAQGQPQRLKVAGNSNKFDSVSFSTPASSDDKFRMALVGRLTQEVRAAHTTGDIAALHDQVAAGSYAPDATSIARRMLLLGDEA